MSRFLLAAVCGLAFTAAPAFADDVKPAAKKADATERILDALAQEHALKEGVNVNEVPLIELLQDASKRCRVPFVINEESFKAIGQQNIKEEKPKSTTLAVGDGTLHQFLTVTLDSLGATYLVKNGTIEIVPTMHAAKVTKSGVSQDEDNRARLHEPLVSAIFKEKPLNEAVAKIAEMYDLTVTFAPQAGDAKTGFVTTRMLNLPADKALELLALQCDLRVVRRGTAFLLTSKDHANELFNEKLDRERQKIEVQKLREAPAKPPAQPEVAPIPPAPAKPPEKAPAMFGGGNKFGYTFVLHPWAFGAPPAFPNLPQIPNAPKP